MANDHDSSEAREPFSLQDDVLRVSQLKWLYFGGKMSLRWWYRQIELGRLPHVRAGATVLVRKADADAFVAAAYKAEASKCSVHSDGPHSSSIPKNSSAPRSKGGLRFFRD